MSTRRSPLPAERAAILHDHLAEVYNTLWSVQNPHRCVYGSPAIDDFKDAFERVQLCMQELGWEPR